MKKLVILAAFMVGVQKLNAQIGKTSVADPTTATKPYDSLNNFLGHNAYQYIGQELYLLEKPENKRDRGYSNFIKDPTKDPNTKWNVYSCCDGGAYSKYKSMAGKTFKVLNVIPATAIKKSSYEADRIYYLQLEEPEKKETLFYRYDALLRYKFPFVVMGFFEKAKQTQIGREYLLRGLNWKYSDDLRDLKTGKIILDYSPNVKWKIVDIAIEEKEYAFSYIMTNTKGETIAIPVETAKNIHYSIAVDELDSIAAIVGRKHLYTALEGKVAIGMNKAAAKLAWGIPKDINKTIVEGLVKEQWVYEKNYLYFENDVLVAIQ